MQNYYYDAFISYGRVDSKAFAIKLNEQLKAIGLNVWIDQQDIPLAMDYQEQINDGIEKTHNFIFIISPHSVNSPYCLKEINLAIQYNKRLIPLLHVEQISQATWQQRNPTGTAEEWQKYQTKGLHSSYPNMHPTISKINWVYYRENIDNVEESFANLIKTISEHQEYLEQHTELLIKALEWERNQKQTHYLLIGEERQAAEAWLQRLDRQLPCLAADLHCEFICESTKNANNLLTQVFLAASEQDEGIKEKISKTLMRSSLTVWTSKRDIKTGSQFQKAINQGIEGADNFVYLMSSDSLKSTYCQEELDQALANNKRIIPLLIEEVEEKLIPVKLRQLQHIDLTKYKDETQYSLSIDKLLGELKKEPSYYEKHKILLVKALKWQRQNQNPSLLLRGYNRQHFAAWLQVAQQRKTSPPLPVQEEYITASFNQHEQATLEVFISYSRTDSDLARKLNDQLQELGKTTWFDQESIATGADFQQEIYRGIESSENFLFIISPKSVNSPYCKDEVEYAQKLNKRFVTILHRPLSADDRQNLPEGLATVQWLDFNQHGGEFFANFNELVRTLDTDRDHVRSHTKWQQRAMEWQNNHNNTDLLLRGSEFVLGSEWLFKAETEKKKPAPTALQKELIAQSGKAQEEQLKAIEAQLKRERELTQMALEQLKQAELNQAKALGYYSLSLFNEHKELEAFVEAIRAGKILQKYKTKNPVVIRALQEALYQGSERSRLGGHNTPVVSVSFSPDGETLASGSYDNTIKLWNVESGKEIRTLMGHSNYVYSVSFSPDGETLASGSWDKIIKLWNVETGKEIRTLIGHTDSVRSVSFSPDGVTTASGSDDNTIKLWNVETGKEIRTLIGHNNYVLSVSFSPDGETLASGSWDNTIKLWNVETGKEIHTLIGHSNWVNSVSFSPDGVTLASGSDDNTIKLWNVEIGKEICTLTGHSNYVTSVSFSPDGVTLATGSYDKTIKLWNVETGKEIRTLMWHTDSVRSVSFSPDGETTASGSYDNTIKLSNVETGKEILTLSGHFNPVYSVSFSPDGVTLASGSADKTIKLWNVETEKEIRTLIGHSNSVRSVSFSPDGVTLASGSADKTIKLWNVETGKEILTLSGHTNHVRNVSFSPDGVTLASGSADKTIKLWNVETGKEILTLIGHSNPVRSVSFSPDGVTTASGSDDKTIKLWNVETGKEIRTLIGHSASVTSVSFSPNRVTLASGSDDKTIKLWNVETGKEIRTLIGHSASVTSVSFSPDGVTLASGSYDNTIKLWNVETGKEISTFAVHFYAVWSISFSPDGKTLASGSLDNTIKLWNLYSWTLDLDSLMGRSCDWVRGYLENNPNVSEEDRHLCD